MTTHPFYDSSSSLLLNHHSFDDAPPLRARSSLLRRFSTEGVVSTEVLFSSDETSFHGAYGHVRKKLDYDYHKHYRKERQWLHDSIIEEILESQEESKETSPVLTHPRLILTVGPQGAGKRYTVEKLVEQKRLLMPSCIVVDIGTFVWHLQPKSVLVATLFSQCRRRDSKVLARVFGLHPTCTRDGA